MGLHIPHPLRNARNRRAAEQKALRSAIRRSGLASRRSQDELVIAPPVPRARNQRRSG